MLQVPDVNVLIYAGIASSAGHAFYAEWLDRHTGTGREFGMSGPVLTGFVRIATSLPSRGGGLRLPEALAFCDRLTANLNCRLIQPGGAHWRLFGELCRRTGITGGGTSDVSHAAIALEHSVEWVTADKGFSVYPGLRWRLLPVDVPIHNPP